MTWIAVALGGALGSMARHAVSVILARLAPSLLVPYATVTVNLIGCFVIGLLAGLLTADRIALRFHWREFVFVGLLGGFTTFSTFGLDTFLLTRTHSIGSAGFNIAAQVIGGLVAVWAGYQLGWSRA